MSAQNQSHQGTHELNALLERAVERAEALGASYADAVGVDVTEGSVRVRLGEIEELTRSRERQLGLRVFMGQRSATSSTSDLREGELDRFVEAVVAMARLTAEDPHAGLPHVTETAAQHLETNELFDPESERFDLERGVEWCKVAERVAMADSRVKNSEGAGFGFGAGLRAYRASGGVAGSYRTSSFSGSVTPIAEHEGAMERDYWWSARRHLAELESAESVGQKALSRTLRRLGARRLPTGERPVVFDSLTASALLRHVAGAVNAYTVYRGASVLGSRMGSLIASPLITVVDDATLRGGMATRPYDGEGLGSRRTPVIVEGRLESWLADTYSGKKVGRASTGNAARSVADAPTAAPTNFHLQPSTNTLDALLSGIADGFYVTELIGFGVNVTTGDFSQGAAGLRIVNGALDHAVSEVTIAGNLLDMLRDVEAVGDDLDLTRSVSSPSLRLGTMMVAGE